VNPILPLHPCKLIVVERTCIKKWSILEIYWFEKKVLNLLLNHVKSTVFIFMTL
jgi:hypothetical protein